MAALVSRHPQTRNTGISLAGFLLPALQPKPVITDGLCAPMGIFFMVRVRIHLTMARPAQQVVSAPKGERSRQGGGQAGRLAGKAA
jgi:hypothetical protein